MNIVYQNMRSRVGPRVWHVLWPILWAFGTLIWTHTLPDLVPFWTKRGSFLDPLLAITPLECSEYSVSEHEIQGLPHIMTCIMTHIMTFRDPYLDPYLDPYIAWFSTFSDQNRVLSGPHFSYNPWYICIIWHGIQGRTRIMTYLDTY